MAALPDARPIFTAQGLRLSSRRRGRGRSRAAAAFPTRLRIPRFPGSFEQRHPIVVAAAPTSVDLYPVGGSARRAFTGECPRLRGALSALRLGRGHDSDACGNEPKLDSRLRGPQRASRRRRQRQGRHRETICRRTTARRRRCACRSRGSRRSFRPSAVSGRRIWLRDHRSKGGRTNPTRTSAAPPNRRSRLRSTTRAISSSRARSVHPMSPCAPEPSRPSATAKIRAPIGRTPFSRQSAAICRPTETD